MNYDFDFLVIGAGSGGLAASKRAAAYGAKVAICESDKVGGTCVIYGCVPKKLMVYAAHFKHSIQDASGYGWQCDGHFSWEKLKKNRDHEINRLNTLHMQFLKKAGVSLLTGEAFFHDPHTLRIGGRLVSAKHILIAVGGEAIVPNIPGAAYAGSSNNLFTLQKQPSKILIWGGGYIAVEFACLLNQLGSEVHLIHRNSWVLRGFDQDLREKLQTAMHADGLHIHTDITLKEIKKGSKGYTVLDSKGCRHSVSHVLAAIGREPKTDGLKLDKIGILRNQKAIKINDQYQTNQPHIYAVGDCTDRYNLTPVAIAEGRAVADHLYGASNKQVAYTYIPTAVFTNPELASVGETEATAKERLGESEVCVYTSNFKPLYHSLSKRDARTFMKLITESKTDRVLGLHMIGEAAGEIIQMGAIALQMGATKADFDRTMALHPSSAEEFVTMR